MNAAALCERGVVSVDGQTPVTEAARLMRERGMRELIVVDKESRCGVPLGLVFDRDLAVEVLAYSADWARSLTLADINHEDFVTVDESEHMTTALRRMRIFGVDRLIVVDSRGVGVGVLRYERILETLVTELIGLIAFGQSRPCRSSSKNRERTAS